MELTGFLPTLRRWWWLLVAATVLAALAGYAVASRMEPVYEAEVRALVGPVNTDRDTLLAAGQLAQTYAELAASQPLLEATVADLGLTVRPESLRGDIAASANQVTRIVTIRVRRDDPQVAAAIANSLAVRLAERTSAGVPLQTGVVTVVDEARPAQRPVEPQVPVLVVLAAMAGAIGALVLVVAIERLRDVVSSANELPDLVDLDVLVAVPQPALVGGARRSLAVVGGPRSDRAAAYRLLASRLLLAGADRGVRSVAILGTDRDDGSGEVAANVAAALTGVGQDVTLLDLNHRAGTATRLLGLDPRPGVAEQVGSQEISLDLAPVGSGWLNALPSDPDAIDTSITLDWARRLVGQLVGEGDLVLLNPAPVRRSSDSMIWARAVDAVVVVVRQERTSRTALTASVESLRSVGAEVMGIVVHERRRRVLDRHPALAATRMVADRPGPPATPDEDGSVLDDELDASTQSSAETQQPELTSRQDDVEPLWPSRVSNDD